MGPTGSLDRKPTAGQPGPQGTGAALLRGAPARNPGLPFVCVHVCTCVSVCVHVRACVHTCERAACTQTHAALEARGAVLPTFFSWGSEVR